MFGKLAAFLVNFHFAIGSNATHTLQEQQDHNTKVAIQKELYSAMQQEGLDLSPEQFLRTVFKNMPDSLVEKRKEEIKDQDAKIPRDSLPKMLAVAQILQDV